MPSKSLKDIATISESDIDKLVVALTTKGIVLEVDVSFLYRVLIDQYCKDIETLARENGYDGGELFSIATETIKDGWVYALYDKERMGSKTAIKLIKQKSKENHTNNEPEEITLATLVRKFSAFYNEGDGWDSKKAQKKHTDLFGDTIEPGTYYFRLPWGYSNYHADIKLSEKNMKLVCEMLFQMPSSIAEKHADWIIDKRLERVRSVVDKLSPENKRLNDPRFFEGE